MNSLGSIIREARKEKNLTTTELAKKVDLTQGYISHIENNRKNPSYEILNKLSKVLDVPYLDLMLAAGYYTDEDLRHLKEQEDFFDSMTEEDQQAYIDGQVESLEIEEFRREFYPDIEELLSQNIFFDKYKLTKTDKKIVYKILKALFEGKEKNYPTDQEIENEFRNYKKSLENFLNFKNKDGSPVFEDGNSNKE